MATTAKTRADRLKQILDDEAFRDACQATEDAILAEWKAAATTEAREALWYTHKGLTRLLRAFHGFINEAVMEEHLDKPQQGT